MNHNQKVLNHINLARFVSTSLGMPVSHSPYPDSVFEYHSAVASSGFPSDCTNPVVYFDNKVAIVVDEASLAMCLVIKHEDGSENPAIVILKDGTKLRWHGEVFSLSRHLTWLAQNVILSMNAS